MATPISLDAPPHDPRVALRARLAQAPAEHAEALLAMYQVLQGLHDSGALDLLRGALGSRNEVLGVAVRAAGSAGSIRAIRNLVLLIEMLGTIEPNVLKVFTRAAPEAMSIMIEQPEKPGLWALMKDFIWNQDFRHGMAALNTMLETFGRRIAESNSRDLKDS